MRTLWPNLDGEEGLETVLEVPVPDEMFAGSKSGGGGNSWRALKNWLIRPSSDYATRAVEIQFLLGIIGAPLIPLPTSSHHNLNHHTIKSHPIERSMAAYIVKQYVAASGGDHALNSIQSMCAMGKVKMAAAAADLNTKRKKSMKVQARAGELGGFVLWQKAPHLWSLELMLSGFKISAGCDGKAAWRQTPWQHSGASRGPPRPLRRSLQGLDPRRSADLFSDSICIGEKTISGQDCFVLKVEAEASSSRSSSSEVIKHTIWGSFSQKTGLLVHLQDSHSLRINSAGKEVVWETKTESSIQDYRTIDGVNIAHGGRTTVALSRYDEEAGSHSRSRMEEVWSIEEVDLNVRGLSTDCFLPPADMEKEGGRDCDGKEGGLRYEVLGKYGRNCSSRGGKKVAAVDEDYCDSDEDDEL